MVYVGSERAGQRVMESVTRYVERRLKLKVNRRKSAVAEAVKRPFLGFQPFRREGEVRIGVDPDAIKRAKARLRALTSRSRGVSMERRIEQINRFTVGRMAYYRLADSPYPFERLDKWLRRRLRQVAWKQWKHPNAKRRALLACGIPERDAIGLAHSRRYWRIAGSPTLQRALPNAHWQALGLKGLLDPYRRFRDATRTAGCGPACPVVWEGPG